VAPNASINCGARPDMSKIGAAYVSPNKSLQRSGTHKVLGRGRPSVESTRVLRARVLRGRRAAAELGR
jgi:hypothetical protein